MPPNTAAGLAPEWCLAPGEPASLLPAAFTLVDQNDLPGSARRQMLARRAVLRTRPGMVVTSCDLLAARRHGGGGRVLSRV